ncbi:MAG: succinylglutamate desuccinylase/aspartoacylase family protein [Gemmatimonadota bacterium]
MSRMRVGDAAVDAGERRRIELPVARLPTGNQLSLPVEVIRGSEPGPAMWLSGAVHGDEVIGVEIIRRVTERLDPTTLSGTVISVPIVNVFGFINESRYLPDRRDLNRAFPGRERGSLASRLAHLFMEEVVRKCDYGIDFHAGSDDRVNLPQIRANLDDEETRRCALAFAAPVAIHASLRDGSLREAAAGEGVHVLLYEGGEARRFDTDAVNAGVAGTLRTLECLEMCETDPPDPLRARESRKTQWVRASRSGIFHLDVEAGDRVEEEERLGQITNSFGDEQTAVRARGAGVVIGHTLNPLVNRGDALVHVARLEE